jgi:hypothetical protein
MADPSSVPSLQKADGQLEIMRKPVASLRRKPVQQTIDDTPIAVSEFVRQKLQRAGTSYASVPQEGSVLTGKQEHCKTIPKTFGCKFWGGVEQAYANLFCFYQI